MSRKDKLRQWCIDEYGIMFGIMYDKVNAGDMFGGINDTILIWEMIEEVRKKHRNIFQRLKERGKR